MSTDRLTIRPLTKSDYDEIVSVIDRWWGGPTSALAHPIFFYELGELSRVVTVGERLVGFMLAFIAPAGPTGYVHLVGIDPEHRRRRVGTGLYRSFEQACRAAGCREMKAITTVGNEEAQHFHRALGYGVATIPDYAGPGRMRVVFSKDLHAHD
jgi:ribosomal protein S18 acetylase RimI-like enzyme